MPFTPSPSERVGVRLIDITPLYPPPLGRVGVGLRGGVNIAIVPLFIANGGTICVFGLNYTKSLNNIW